MLGNLPVYFFFGREECAVGTGAQLAEKPFYDISRPRDGQKKRLPDSTPTSSVTTTIDAAFSVQSESPIPLDRCVSFIYQQFFFYIR